MLGEDAGAAQCPGEPRPRIFHVVQFPEHRLAPVTSIWRRDVNRGFQEHCRSLAEVRFQHHSHPIQKAGCRTTARGRASANLLRANSNPSGVSL